LHHKYGLNRHGGRHGDGDATASFESASEFDVGYGGYSGEPVGHWLCGHAELVDRPERFNYQRDTDQPDKHLFGDLYDGSWLYDHRVDYGQHGPIGEFSGSVGDGVLRFIGHPDSQWLHGHGELEYGSDGRKFGDSSLDSLD
jgi:hypothetical protein